MSGIFGFAGPPDHALLARMAAVLAHRGPDGGGALECDAVSDLDARVLGASPGADRALVHRLMLDDPLGQGHEQTPVCVLRDLGPLAPPD
jgi:hypothetical protein